MEQSTDTTPKVKVVKKDNIDKHALAVEAIKRIREEQADMKRRMNGLLAAWDKKIASIESLLKGH